MVTALPSGRLRRVLEPKDLGVRQLDEVLVQSPDGARLAISGGVEAVLVDTSTLAPRTYLAGQGWTNGLAFSADGTRVAASGDRLTVWALHGSEAREILVERSGASLPAFSRDGQTLYTATLAGLVQAWDLDGSRRFLASRVGEASGLGQPVVRVSPGLDKVAYVEGGPRLRIRDLATGRLGPVLALPMQQRSFIDVAWHPDDSTVNVTTGDPVVRTWAAATGRMLAQHRLGPPDSSEGAAIAFFTDDGKYLLVGSTTGRLHVLDARTLSPLRAPVQVTRAEAGQSEAAPLGSLVFSTARHTAYAGDQVVDYLSGAIRTMPDLGAPVKNLQTSPDGNRLLVDLGDAGVGLLDATTMKWVSTPVPTQAGLMGYSTRFSDDGSLVASVNEGKLSDWDGVTGTYLGSTTVNDDGEPAFTKDDRRILFAGAGGALLTWTLDPRSWLATACRLAGRPLTEQEWHTYLPGRPFVPVCAS